MEVDGSYARPTRGGAHVDAVFKDTHVRSPPHLDVERFLDIVGDIGLETAKRILEKSESDIATLLEIIGERLQNGDVAGFLRPAHSLKGLLSQIHLDSAAFIARQFELSPDLADSAHLEQLRAKIDAGMREARAQIAAVEAPALEPLSRLE